MAQVDHHHRNTIYCCRDENSVCVSGPLCSVLVNRFGCRPVMMIGGLFASLGMIVASFATNIMHIYLSAGVITGTLST